MHHQVNRLAGKAARAELRKNEQLSREAAELMNGLFPADTLQERIIPGVLVLGEHGMGLLEGWWKPPPCHCQGTRCFIFECPETKCLTAADAPRYARFSRSGVEIWGNI